MPEAGQYQYLFWLLLFVALPMVVVFGAWGSYLWQYRKVFAYCLGFSLLFGYPWDVWAVHSNMWHYYPNHLVGWWWLGLPLEEYLYLLTVPLLFTAVTLLIRKQFKSRKSS